MSFPSTLIETTIYEVTGGFIDFGMVFAPCIGYVIQAVKFKTKKSSKHFSLYTCLILVIANILRINFWFGKHFTAVLLYQAIVVVLAQIFLIYFYLRYKTDNNEKQAKKSLTEDISYFCESISDFDLFWQWDTLMPYIYGIGMIFFINYIFTVILINNIAYIELVGFISTGIEIILGFPQLISNYKNKNVETLSFVMICLWTLGDFFKTGYFIVTDCPMQFIIFSIIRVFIDFVLIAQIWYYNSDNLGYVIIEEIGMKGRKKAEEGNDGKEKDLEKGYGTIEKGNDC